MALYDAKDFHIIFQQQTQFNQWRRSNQITAYTPYMPISYEVKTSYNREFEVRAFGQEASEILAGPRTLSGSMQSYLTMNTINGRVDNIDHYLMHNYYQETSAGTENAENIFVGRTYSDPSTLPTYGLTAHVQYIKGSQQHSLYQRDLFLTEKTIQFSNDNPLIVVTHNFVGGSDTSLNIATPETSTSQGDGELASALNTSLVLNSDSTTNGVIQWTNMTITMKTGASLLYGSGTAPTNTAQNHSDNLCEFTFTTPYYGDTAARYTRQLHDIYKNGENVDFKIETSGFSDGNLKYNWHFSRCNITAMSPVVIGSGGVPTVDFTVVPVANTDGTSATSFLYQSVDDAL